MQVLGGDWKEGQREDFSARSLWLERASRKIVRSRCLLQVKGVHRRSRSGPRRKNDQLLKNLFQACTMHNVEHLSLPVRKVCRTSNDFERVVRFLDTLYASDHNQLQLAGNQVKYCPRKPCKSAILLPCGRCARYSAGFYCF